jgi:hypothetical protein
MWPVGLICLKKGRTQVLADQLQLAKKKDPYSEPPRAIDLKRIELSSIFMHNCMHATACITNCIHAWNSLL